MQSAYRNLVDLHRRQAERFGPRPALRFKRHGLYHDYPWHQYRADAVACAAALIDAGVRPGDRVGLLSENRREWLVADLGILAAGAVNVPPHATLPARQIQFQLADSGASWLFVSSREQLDKVRSMRSELPGLRGIVMFDRGASGEAAPWEGFLQRGRVMLACLADEVAGCEAALGTDDLATIMYTSGTTGNPKGVMLTHGNLLSNAVASAAADTAGPADILLSWLPYSHIYARLVDHYAAMVSGMTVCLAESQDTLVLNLAETCPTRLTSVPRFYEKVYAAVAADPKETARRLRGVFGPRIQLLMSGGAPLPKPVAEAYHVAGLLVLQGYGLTESSPVITFNRKQSYKLDTVGQPLPGVEVRIADDGEILTRGPHVMKGYWNNPRATAEAIRDGWLYTGDLGALDADGFLRITGRKKDLLVLSNGKKVVPSEVEGRLMAEPCIDQVVVYGEGRNYLTALVVPHWDNLRRALREEGKPADGTAEALAADPAVAQLLERRMHNAVTDLAPWECPKRFVVLSRPFSVAADELTVSLKLRRNVIFEHFKKELEALYRE
ncbi:MAG TPA: long-chain fatty acid--CoA ligase [Gemmataceae bacterium]|nr:long-chain fatty acid--CoA ligase [Gemmataceae bacterium]